MVYADDILNEVTKQLAPQDIVLEGARDRRDAVLGAARRFPGIVRTFNSGSVAHGTVNDPVNDADCGAVLDRQVYGDLGPDSSAGGGPVPVVQEMREHLREDEQFRDVYPEARFQVQDRSIKVSVNEPFANGQDPTVDLILALDRVGARGLWIPRSMTTNPGWSASHPEMHTRLFLPDDMELRRTRVRSVRFGKAWNARFSEPYFSSFNIAAWAYWGIDRPMGLAAGLAQLFVWAYSDLSESLTEDPARVSGKIKLLTTKDAALQRLRKARDLAVAARDAHTEKDAQEALSKLFPSLVGPPSSAVGALTDALRRGEGAKYGLAGLVAAGAGESLKPTNSFGSGL